MFVGGEVDIEKYELSCQISIPTNQKGCKECEIFETALLEATKCSFELMIGRKHINKSSYRATKYMTFKLEFTGTICQNMG